MQQNTQREKHHWVGFPIKPFIKIKPSCFIYLKTSPGEVTFINHILLLKLCIQETAHMFQNHSTDNEGKFHTPLEWTHTSLQFSGITFFFFFFNRFSQSILPNAYNKQSVSWSQLLYGAAYNYSRKKQPTIDVCVSSLHSSAFWFHQIKVYSKIRHYILH